MPQFGADGDVVDIALNSVRVQNWDKTYTVIPTHKFLEHSFKNWRGMSESGGRRIKRAFHVDMTTIRFLTPEEIDRFGRFVLLRDYIARKKAELEAHNRAYASDADAIVNARRLTNVGTLRAYIIAYLRQHPKVHQEMTFLVRQLEPTPHGLPIEIYVFSSETAWVAYEGIQADIFDHILAMVPEFGLRVYQQPSGYDVAAALGSRVLQPA
jgi:miniconductance mechanosensitive channel